MHEGVGLYVHNYRSIYLFKVNDLSLVVPKDTNFKQLATSRLKLVQKHEASGQAAVVSYILLEELFREKKQVTGKFIIVCLIIAGVVGLVTCVWKVFLRDDVSLRDQTVDDQLELMMKLSSVNDDLNNKTAEEAKAGSDEDSIDRHNRACDEMDNSNL